MWFDNILLLMKIFNLKVIRGVIKLIRVYFKNRRVYGSIWKCFILIISLLRRDNV